MIAVNTRRGRIYTDCSKQVSIEVSVGKLLGYAGGGGQGSAALDFGLRDSRLDPIFYANTQRVVNSDQLYVACPYDYYADTGESGADTGESGADTGENGSVRDILQAKLQNVRTTPPVCGTVALDEVNTAQGRWYLVGSSDSSENDHIALVPSNKQPATVAVLSIGNSSIGTDAYYFDFQSTGLVNLAFDQVTADGNIYCWDRLRDSPEALVNLWFYTL